MTSFTDIMWEARPAPNPLWHYTNSAGLLGIANNKSLWCTEYRFLNDHDEILAFTEQIQRHLRQELKPQLSDTDIASAVNAIRLIDTWQIFVCSFCADGDRNEHWQQYARKAGYALGFDARMLRSLGQEQGFLLGPVIYGSDKAQMIASSVIKDQLSVFQNFKSPLGQADLGRLVGFACQLVLHFAPFFKPAHFEWENEWRLVKTTKISGPGNMKFRASKAFGLVNYCELTFGDSREELSKLVPHIRVGPGNETSTIMRSHVPYTLCEKAGLSTLASQSTSSFRFIEA